MKTGLRAMPSFFYNIHLLRRWMFNYYFHPGLNTNIQSYKSFVDFNTPDFEPDLHFYQSLSVELAIITFPVSDYTIGLLLQN